VLAAYAVVLSRYARQRDLVIALPVSGRIRPELERIVGPFADIVPLRVSVTGTFAELRARVRDAAAEALSHDELPFDKLAAELGVARPVVGFSTTGQECAEFQLNAGVEGTLTLAYRADVYETPFAERFLRSVVAVLEHAGQHPHTPVVDLPLQPPQETLAVPVPDLDVVRALRESEASITDSTGTVPMSEVCRRAAVLARAISEQDSGPQVGVCVRRGVGLLVAVLGTWWAGRTAVLLDPEFPLPGLEKRVRNLKLVVADEERVIGDATVVTPAEGEPIDPVEPDPVAYVVDGRDVTHRAVADVLAVLHRDLPLGAGDRFAATGTAADVALMELLLPLVCGADVVVTDGEDLNGITALHASAYTWRHLPTVPDSVRLRLCTGLTPDLAEALDTPGAELWHGYGDAESALWPVAGRWPATNRSRAAILDERGVPVPIGAIGEVHVGDHETGDLARGREDGRLELVGRTDDKVEVRGTWVDPGGIAAELRTHRAVRDAVVIGAPKDGETVLVAYVVSDESGEALRQHLRATLPERMVPELFVALDELSDTLPEPDWGQPRDDVEATMVRIWADLLRTTDRIAVHDNLFGRGAGSLTVMRFAAKVAEAYGVNLPLHRIFATPTIAALAAVVTAERQPEPDDGLAGLSDTELDDLLRSVLAARDRRRTARGEAG
jgi:non-ribosomal peptide synthetase component F/aryl carrier-like protein